MDLVAVEDLLQYHFQAAHIAEEALTAAGVATSSDSSKATKSKLYGNKRLALLGDALIRLSVVDEWYPSGSSPGKSRWAPFYQPTDGRQHGDNKILQRLVRTTPYLDKVANTVWRLWSLQIRVSDTKCRDRRSHQAWKPSWGRSGSTAVRV